MAIGNYPGSAAGIATAPLPGTFPMTGPADEIKVGMGDIVVSRAPYKLAIIGLGSCVGVALYYQKEQIGGLAHIMLPDSTKSRNSTSREKFADTGLAIMLEWLKKNGANPMWMTARLVGGASMFKTSGANGTSPMFNIGENNVRACREFLKKEHIRITGEEVQGTVGRTMRFDLATGKITVRYADGGGTEL